MASILQKPEILFSIMLAVLFLGTIFSRITRIPNIIVLILGGLLVGPYGFQWLPLNDTVESFSTLGLIYLMFNVGLEVDLGQFSIYRKRTGIFFLLTYLIPQFSGLVVGWLFGLSMSSSILLGAIYASYTLVAYPVASQLGILKNEAVAISVLTCMFTDITALFILTIIMNTQAGDFSWFTLSKLTGMIVLCTSVILIAIPYMSRFFFRCYSDERINFLFAFMLLFVSATLAQVTGLHAVVGAFLGGLAVNRMLSKESRVTKQILFTGETIFIPLFLIAIGLRLDLEEIFSSWNTLLFGLTLTFAVYTTKFAAAWIAARLFHYSRPQMWTMWGLTQAQAAATLAIILIGTKAHLFSKMVLQGSIIMVLFTLITSPILVKYYGNLLKPKSTDKKRYPLLQRILVPVTMDEFPENTLEFAARLARYGQGSLLILNIADTSAVMEARREKLRAGPVKDPDTAIELVNRIEKTDVSQCILNETVESEVSFILMDWVEKHASKERLFSPIVDKTIWSATQPVGVVLLKTPIKSFTRVVAVIGEHMVGIKLQEEFPEIAGVISKILELPLVIMATKHYLDRFETKFMPTLNKSPTTIIPIDQDIIESVLEEVGKDDLVLIPSMGSEERFYKDPNLLPYNLWSESEASLIIFHFT